MTIQLDRAGVPLAPGDQILRIRIAPPPEEVIARGVVVALARTRIKVQWAGRRYGPDGSEWIYPSLVRKARYCTCGATDYASCLCNLTPREWLDYAKTNRNVDQSITLPKELQ